MISLRAKLIHQYILKQRTFSDIKQVLNKSTKTLRQWIAIYKAQGEQGLFPKKPGPKSGSSYNRTAPEIENLVEQLARIHRFEGPISLSYKLEELGYKLNQSTVYRILKRKGLRYHPHEYIPIQRHTKRYVKELPGQEVQIDVSFPFGRSRKLVVYDGIDDCTRIIGSRSYEGYGTNQSLAFMKYLISTMPINISAVRTDCGREFSKEFTDYCNNQGIIHIKNKPYTPQHNGKVERYHYTQRLHCVSYRPYTITVEEANYKLTQRGAFYNTQRRHTGLGMNGLTPIQKLMSVTYQLFYHNCHLNSATQQYLTNKKFGLKLKSYENYLFIKNNSMKIKLHFSWGKLLSTAMVIAGLTMASSTFAQVKLWFDTPSTLSALPSWGQYTNNPAVTYTLNRNTFCWYPTRVLVNSSGYQVWSTDAKFFASGMNLTGFLTGTAFRDYFSQQNNPYLPLTGTTAGAQQNAATIGGLYNYPTNSPYFYINATVGFGNTGVVQASGLTLGTMWYRTNAQTVSTGELVFYWVSTTGDSTNMQSGSTNTFINIVRSLTGDLGHTTGMTFQTWPCILDVDVPLFTGQQSGQTLNYFLDTFSVVTYDWTGSRAYTYSGNTGVSNSTIHYYFNGSNYIAVTTNDIDNQNGINTGSITLNISGTTYAVNAWTGETGMNAFFNGTTGALITLNLTVANFPTASNTGVLGSGMLWTGGTLNARWRGALLSSILSGGALSGIRENQIIRVVFTGADRPNQNGTTNTGNLIYTFTITGFDNIPPYLTTGNYQSTGNNGTTTLGTDGLITRGAGDRFTTAQVTGWTQWTSGNVNLLITGSEVFQILTSTITGAGHGYLTSLNLTINNNAFTLAKVLTFTGNYISGSFQFIDNPLYSGTTAEGGSNTGITITSGSANYAKQFAFDVFWIDQAVPSLTSGYINNSAQNSVPINSNNVRVTVTGGNTGLINYNATAVTTDDEFIILGLSGKNGFPSNPSYAKYDYAGGQTSGTWSLGHSGLVFEQGWEGCVITRDRAGNSVCHDIKIELNQFTMELRAVLAQRLESNNYNWTGIARFYQFSGTSFTGVLTTTGLNITGNTAGTGTWTININNAAATGYLILLKTQSHLSVGYSGFLNWSTLANTGRIFDFSFTGNYQPWSSNATGYLRQFNLSGGVPTYAASKDAMYLVPGDVNWNDIIGATDLAIINSGLTVSLTSPSPANDFDADGFVTSRDQAILIENSSRNGFWRTFNGGFTGAVAPDATPSTSGFWFGNGTF